MREIRIMALAALFLAVFVTPAAAEVCGAHQENLRQLATEAMQKDRVAYEYFARNRRTIDTAIVRACDEAKITDAKFTGLLAVHVPVAAPLSVYRFAAENRVFQLDGFRALRDASVTIDPTQLPRPKRQMVKHNK
ncbi:MAG TPA: hypothetical protein VJK53_06220 [Candidatus Paceibacterota bacterium]